MTEQVLHDEIPTPRTGKRRRQWAVLGAVPIVLAVPIAWLLQTPAQQTVPNLRDGTAYLVATTYGTQHQCLDGPRWQHLLLPLVGRALATAWGWRVIEYTHRKPVLIFWITWKNTGVNTGKPQLERITNEHHSSIPGSPIESIGDRKGPVGTVVEKFPRRGRYVHLDFQTADDHSFQRTRRAGRFVALNPTPGPYPQWKPQPPPLAVRSGETTFVLKQFLVGVADAGNSQPAADPDNAGTILSFAALRNGKAEAGWSPIKASFTNAAGDSWPDAIWQKWDSPSEKLYVPHSLGTEEAAWKIGVDFARASGFTADETWTFHDIRVPSPGALQVVNLQLVRNGTHVRLRSVETRQPKEGISRLTGRLETSLRHPASLLTITGVRDENGRDLSTFGQNQQWLGLGRPLSPHGDRGFAVDAPFDTRRISLTFALHKSTSVTFLAAPTVAGTTPQAAVR